MQVKRPLFHLCNHILNTMEVCLLCLHSVRDVSKSLNDCEDGISLKHIIEDLNYQIPLEQCFTNKICYNPCFSQLMALYNFREMCCNFFEICPKKKKICCKLCKESSMISYSLNDNAKLIDFNEPFDSLLNIFIELCSYDIQEIDESVDILCSTCYYKVIDLFKFHLVFKEASNFWTDFVLNHSKDTEIANLSEFEDFRKYYSDRKSSIDHHDQPPKDESYTCNQCKKAFRAKCDLKKHLESHLVKSPFTCNICSRPCYKKYDLKVHLRSHTGEKPFKCKHCSKSFSQSGALKSHVTIHTGEKPFKCKHCSKSFSQSGALKSHVRIHTGEKPFKCKHCSKSFSQSGALKSHVTIHTGEKPFKCKHCSKSFSQSGALKSHVRIHTGEKPFKCEHCSKSFSQSGALKSHIRIHTGEKPFKCKHCLKSFIDISSLQKHIKTQINSIF